MGRVVHVPDGTQARPLPAVSSPAKLTAEQTIEALARGRTVLMGEVHRLALETLSVAHVVARVGDRLLLRYWPAKLVEICLRTRRDSE